jgi:hypothetical protein
MATDNDDGDDVPDRPASFDDGPTPDPRFELRRIRAREDEAASAKGKQATAHDDSADLGVFDGPPVDLHPEGFDGEGVGRRAPAGLREEVAAAGPAPLLSPTAAAPLQGLVYLARVAVLGSKATHALANAPIRWIWDGVAILGIIVVIAGKVGCGKTTLLFWLLAARANTGEPLAVLGRMVTPARIGGFIVLIEGEHGEASTARKLVRMLRVAGVKDIDAALDRVIFVARKSVRIGSAEWRDVERLVGEGLVSDIALDTLARVAPGDANDEREQIAIFDRVAQAIDRAPSAETKPVVWCAAHLRKGDGGDLDDVSGSAQRTGQADTVLFVNAERRDGQVTSSKVTFQKLREEPVVYPGPVEFTVTGESVAIAGAREKDERPLEVRILDRLALAPQTKNALRDKLGANTDQMEAAVSLLFAERCIETTTVQVRGKPCKAFALRGPR